MPLVHIRRGVRLADPCISDSPWKTGVKAWIAITDGFAFGGIFAYGGVAIAPVSIGAFSVGLLSYGGLAIAAIAWGGFSFGIWAFGAMTFGWDAFSGGNAIAWHFAAGYKYAIAHHYAYGQGVAHAAEVNTPFVRQLATSGWCYRVCMALAPAFYWLMWAWTIPMMLSMFAGVFGIGKRQKATA